MTITEIASQVGVTKQAVYLRLKKAGLDIQQLKTSNGGISDEGCKAILDLFEVKPPQFQGFTLDERCQALTEEKERLSLDLKQAQTDLEAAQHERDEAIKKAADLQQACEVWTAKCELLTEQVAQLIQMRDALTVALTKEQDNTQRLLAAQATHDHGGLFGKLRTLLTGKQ